MKKLIVGLSVLLICLIIGGAAFFFMPQLMGKDSSVQGGEEPAAQDTVFFNLGESIVTNVKNSRRYLKVSLTLEIRSEKDKVYFEKNQYKIRDITIGVLRDKKEEDLSGPEAQDVLKEDLKNALAGKLDISSLTDIHIHDFVMQ